MMKLLLTYALFMVLLTYSPTISTTTNNIRQVTDRDFSQNNNKLIGTATERRFISFINKYGKEYSTREEYMHRLGIFAKNMMRAAEHQALDPTAVHGVTQFSDLSEEEFETRFLGVKGGKSGALLGGGEAPVMDVKGLPKSFDWRDKGAVTPVKMQVSRKFVYIFFNWFQFNKNIC